METAFDRAVQGAIRRPSKGFDRRRAAIRACGAIAVSEDTSQTISIWERIDLGIQTSIDDLPYEKGEIIAHLEFLLSGRAAEEAFYDEASMASLEDFSQATTIAHHFVSRGMFQEFFHIVHYNPMNAGKVMTKAVDEAVDRLLEDCYTNVKTKIRENKQIINLIAPELARRGTLTGSEIIQLRKLRSIN